MWKCEMKIFGRRVYTGENFFENAINANLQTDRQSKRTNNKNAQNYFEKSIFCRF